MGKLKIVDMNKSIEKSRTWVGAYFPMGIWIELKINDSVDFLQVSLYTYMHAITINEKCHEFEGE